MANPESETLFLTNESVFKTETDSRDKENKLTVTKGDRKWGGIN